MPELAESWDLGDMSATFKLRKNATFHDGSPVTARDVKWTFDRAVTVGGVPSFQLKAGSLEKPDWLVLDLDPKGAPFAHVVEVARALHRLLDTLELPSHPKTSGASGLHILIPLGRRYTHEECRTFARLLATLGHQATAEISTLARPIHARAGKVYIDWGQNGHGNTIVAPYSLRPLPGAPASCPLRWSEVGAKLDPGHFTLKTLPKRFETMEDPLLGVLGQGIDMGVAVAAIEDMMQRGKEEG